MDFGKLVRTLVADRGAGMVIASKVHHDMLQRDAAVLDHLPRFVTVIRSKRWHLKMFEQVQFRYERMRAIDLVKELGDSSACREIVRALTTYDPKTQILLLAVDESKTPARYCFTPYRAVLSGGNVEVPDKIEYDVPREDTEVSK